MSSSAITATIATGAPSPAACLRDMAEVPASCIRFYVPLPLNGLLLDAQFKLMAKDFIKYIPGRADIHAAHAYVSVSCCWVCSASALHCCLATG
jgi:hypothetical protein